jgi:hypothetical protein
LLLTRWRHPKDPGTDSQPSWMGRLDAMSPLSAFGLGADRSTTREDGQAQAGTIAGVSRAAGGSSVRLLGGWFGWCTAWEVVARSSLARAR